MFHVEFAESIEKQLSKQIRQKVESGKFCNHIWKKVIQII